MLIKFQDYNGADKVIADSYSIEWNEIYSVLTKMPLHLKEWDQSGKQGIPIFNPKGTNEYIKRHLVKESWGSNIPLPKDLKILGKDFDFEKNGILLEVQFSNYPFLLNNIIRSEVLFKTKQPAVKKPIKILFVVMKTQMLPASQSTLYFEQAVGQTNFLNSWRIFEIPIRLIGLYENTGDSILSRWIKYKNPRYSREPIEQKDIRCSIQFPEKGKRAIIKIN